MNKRPQRRFETEQEILKAIDRAKASLESTIDPKVAQSTKTALKRLGERLSEFRTQRMPFLEDESIPR